MNQPGFFDLADRYEQLSEAGDPLERLNKVIDWERFRPLLTKHLKKKQKSNAGRKPFDYVTMFKIVILQSLYCLSDQKMEYLIRDRLSFMRFLGFDLEDRIPDEKTIWLFREHLTEGDILKKLFNNFNKYLEQSGFKAELGQIIDASIVEAPKQRNNKDENDEIKKNGKAPEDWEEKPSKLRQKDIDARWTKKYNKAFYGFKDHVSIDRKHKLIRGYEVTSASESDTNHFEELLDASNSEKEVFADKAYYSAKRVAELEKEGYEPRIMRQGSKWHKLEAEQKQLNARYSKIRKRVEHVFGHMTNSMGGMFVRTIGITRAKTKVGLMNMAYNMSRLEQLVRLQPA